MDGCYDHASGRCDDTEVEAKVEVEKRPGLSFKRLGARAWDCGEWRRLEEGASRSVEM